MELVARWPRDGEVVEKVPGDLDVRRVPVGRFPHHVAYLVTGDVLHVVAIAHDRRRPAYWSGRIEP